jgi:hypothetical protein
MPNGSIVAPGFVGEKSRRFESPFNKASQMAKAKADALAAAKAAENARYAEEKAKYAAEIARIQNNARKRRIVEMIRGSPLTTQAIKANNLPEIGVSKEALEAFQRKRNWKVNARGSPLTTPSIKPKNLPVNNKAHTNVRNASAKLYRKRILNNMKTRKNILNQIEAQQSRVGYSDNEENEGYY